MPMIEDYSVFFNTAEHATDADFKGVIIQGIFEDQFIEINGSESVRPTYLTASQDVPGVVHGDVLLINTISYNVMGVQIDGTGLVLLILKDPR